MALRQDSPPHRWPLGRPLHEIPPAALLELARIASRRSRPPVAVRAALEAIEADLAAGRPSTFALGCEIEAWLLRLHRGRAA